MLGSIARRCRKFVTAPVIEILESRGEKASQSAAASQLMLKMHYQSLVQQGRPLPAPSDVGLRVYSQSDEDGILLYLFAVVGTSSKRCIEICAADGVECNTANLIINHGWYGLLVDGGIENVERGTKYYAQGRDTYVFPPKFVQAWVTREKVDSLIRDAGFDGDVDLLSIDVDGVDYWIWDAISVVTPRVVVVEYQDILGPERCWTVPYADDFSASNHPRTNGLPNFAGASLAAFAKLAARKGYRLVATNRYGYNAFFLRNDLGQGVVPELRVSDCFSHPKVVWGMRERFPSVAHLPWVEV